MNIQEAYDYIESLPDYRGAQININFSRLEDRRRKVMSGRHYVVSATVKRTQKEYHKDKLFFMAKSYNESLEVALEDAVNQLKVFLNG